MPNKIPPIDTAMETTTETTSALNNGGSVSRINHNSEKEDNTLSGQTTAALRESIVKGDIAPGEKLNEPSLAEKFAVSRGPLREAIRRLVAMGLVRHTPHVGATVITLELNSIIELYDVREVLEGKAAALAAINMNDQQIKNLHQVLEIHRQHHRNNAGEYMQAEGDFDFHYQIINGSGNALLKKQLFDELYHLIRMFRYQTSRYQSRSDKALIEHQQLIYAIEQRDSHLAETLMRSHIERAKESIKRYYAMKNTATKDTSTKNT